MRLMNSTMFYKMLYVSTKEKYTFKYIKKIFHFKLNYLPRKPVT